MGQTGTNNAWLVFRSLNSYRIQFLTHDLFAGLTLAAIAIPEQMATARLGGFTAQIGFFAFLAGSLAFAVFGSNRFLSCGADSTITPIFAGGLAILAASSSPNIRGWPRLWRSWSVLRSSLPEFSVWVGSRICSRYP